MAFLKLLVNLVKILVNLFRIAYNKVNKETIFQILISSDGTKAEKLYKINFKVLLMI